MIGRILQGEPGVQSRCSKRPLLIDYGLPEFSCFCSKKSDSELVVLIFTQLQLKNKDSTDICTNSEMTAQIGVSERDWTGFPGLWELGVLCVLTGWTLWNMGSWFARRI